jgi:NAD-dependent dihydropyrimidine dehydrogenase PreA subunit
MNRSIIRIDEEKCNGCGACIPNCHEGALQIIDNKAVLVSDLMCDGLGACIGHCPLGALEIIEREAEPYDEVKVMKEMVRKGKNVVIAHLKHLKEHGEFGYLRQGVAYLTQNRREAIFDVDEVIRIVHHAHGGGGPSQPAHQQGTFAMAHQEGGCPGAQTRSFTQAPAGSSSTPEIPSALTHWPVQMHLINPGAGYFQGADVLVAADCVAFSVGNFHAKFLQGKKLAIACPKLDAHKEIYLEKMVAMIDEAKVNTITVMIMEVPCCGGLLHLVLNAKQAATRSVPVKAVTVGIQGDILSEEWK